MDKVALRAAMQEMNDNLVKVAQLHAKFQNDVNQLLLVPLANMFKAYEAIDPNSVVPTTNNSFRVRLNPKPEGTKTITKV